MKPRAIIILVMMTWISLSWVFIVWSRPPETRWEEIYGGYYWEEGNSVVEVSDGGFIVAGTSSSYGAGGADVYLVRVDQQGDKIWEKTYGGSSWVEGCSVVEVSDGGFIVAGTSSPYGLGEVSDVYLVRVDQHGGILWEKTYGGQGKERGYSVIEVSSGGFIVAGLTESYGAGGADVYLVRVDQQGDKIWEKTYGGLGRELCNSVIEVSSGGFVVVGATESDGAGWDDVYLVSVDQQGDKIWEKTYGGAEYEWGYSIVEVRGGGFIVVGFTESYGAGGDDVYLVRVDQHGGILWEKTYGGPGNEWGHSVAEVSMGGFIIAGSTDPYDTGSWHVYLVMIDSDMYKLILFSDFGFTQGAGFYLTRTAVTFSVMETIILNTTGTRYVFLGWKSNSPGGYNGPESTVEVIMNNDITQTAQWKKQYYLQIIPSQGGSVTPTSGWYDEGSTITLSAEPDQSFLVRPVFSKWGGDVATETQVISVTMDSPKSLYVIWGTDYSQAYLVGALAAAVIIASTTQIRKARRKQAADALINKILKAVISSNEAVPLKDLAKNHATSIEEVKSIIEKALKSNHLQGIYLTDGIFINQKALHQIVAISINNSKSAIQLNQLAQQLSIPIEMLEKLVRDLIERGVIFGEFTTDGKGFVTTKVIKSNIQGRTQ